MTVVSNTSPLTNLSAIGQFDLLQQLYDQIYIPDAVWAELNYGGHSWPGAREVEESAWITQYPAQNHNLIIALQRDLDRGEAESIALAIELEADLLLMDEREGRRLAQRQGVPVAGVLGVLLEARKKGLLTEVRYSLTRLREDAGFYISEDVFAEVLRLAEESGD